MPSHMIEGLFVDIYMDRVAFFFSFVVKLDSSNQATLRIVVNSTLDLIPMVETNIWANGLNTFSAKLPCVPTRLSLITVTLSYP